MSTNPQSHALELEIHRLLIGGQPVPEIISEIIKKLENKLPTRDELETFSQFCLFAGEYQNLNQFLLECIERGLTLPWAHFAESLFSSNPAIPKSIKLAFIEGAKEENLLPELARSRRLDHFDETLKNLWLESIERRHKSYFTKKDEMIIQIITLESQGLHDEADKIFEQVRSQYPFEPKVLELLNHRKKRKAQDLLSTPQVRKHREPIDLYAHKDPESERILGVINQQMIITLEQMNFDPELAYDFAVAQAMWENYDAALGFIEPQSITDSTEWLRLEVLFYSRHFVELLQALEQAEIRWAHDPDSIFGILYLRAQAHWELGHEKSALEIMQNIVHARSGYRSSESLLAAWISEFSEKASE